MSLWSLTPHEHDRLARRTAEMLALPEMVCDKRLCRRTHTCEFFDKKSGKRWCLRRLDPEARAAWDELHAIVIRIADIVHAMEPSRDTRLRELEEAAIEIVRAVPLHDPLCYWFRSWLKAYRSGTSEETAGRNLHPPRQAPAGGDQAPVDASLNAGASGNGQFLLPEDVDPDDFRSYG